MSAFEELEQLLRNSDVGYLDHLYGADAEPAAIADGILKRRDAETLREAADEMDAHCEKFGVLGVGDRLRRMADAAEHGEKDTASAATSTPTASGCVCRTDPAEGPAHEGHGKWCPASRPTVERIAEIRQGIGDELTRDELHWLSGAAGRNEAHIIGARGGHWPLTDDLPGVVVLLAQYLAATVAVIERSQPYASTSPSWEKDTREGESTPQPAELTVYRASHESIVMGLYTTAAAAREHCETYARNEHIGDGELALWWREDEDTVDQPEEGTAELIESTHPHYSRPTGYVVTPLTVASAYDEEADE